MKTYEVNFKNILDDLVLGEYLSNSFNELFGSHSPILSYAILQESNTGRTYIKFRTHYNDSLTPVPYFKEVKVSDIIYLYDCEPIILNELLISLYTNKYLVDYNLSDSIWSIKSVGFEMALPTKSVATVNFVNNLVFNLEDIDDPQNGMITKIPMDKTVTISDYITPPNEDNNIPL